MKLNLLYDELNEIIINKDNNYIKMMSFESSTRSSLLAAFEGIHNTITIINLNNKYNITIDEFIDNGKNKKIFLNKDGNINIILSYYLDNNDNIFTVTAIYCNNI